MTMDAAGRQGKEPDGNCIREEEEEGGGREANTAVMR